MKIFLIGFMGCGKTTLGGRLAAKLNYEFVDLDKTLEESAGKSIAEYFKIHGEQEFRKFERQVLQTTYFPENAVISTGGGAPCYFDNIEWMNRNGVTVYISMSPKALAVRLKNAKNERPLLKDLTDEELVEFISGKLQERDPYYLKAKYIVEGINITPEKVIKSLKELT